jgi:hypothetical protein
MKESAFRKFCQDKWYEHVDEKLMWENKTPSYGSEFYFHKNKWTLKQMYLEKFAQENAREIQKQIKRSMKKGNL